MFPAPSGKDPGWGQPGARPGQGLQVGVGAGVRAPHPRRAGAQQRGSHPVPALGLLLGRAGDSCATTETSCDTLQGQSARLGPGGTGGLCSVPSKVLSLGEMPGLCLDSCRAG